MNNPNARKNYIKKAPEIKKSQRFLSFIWKAQIPVMLALAGITILICIYSYKYLIQWEYFNVKKISIKGQNIISEQAIKKCAGIYEGINILSINLFAAKKKVLSIPWIAEVEIKPLFPSEIHINVKEHEPVAVLDIGRKFIINKQGKIYKRQTYSDPDNLPVVLGLKYSDINDLNEFNSIAFKAVMNVLQFGQETGSVIPNTAIEAISIDREMGIILNLNTDSSQNRVHKIKLGYDNYLGKYKQLRRLMQYFDYQEDFVRIDYIDLTNLDRIVVNPIRTESLPRDNKEV